MLPIAPFLSFDSQAEDAANFYVALFPESSVRCVTRYPESFAGRAGQAMTVDFVLNGQPWIALNGHATTPSLAVSFLVRCDTQEEVDHYWAAFADGGREIQCGWVTDRFGVTWQVVPNALMRLMAHPDAAARERVMAAMLQMVKFDIAGLEKAAAG